MKQLRIFTFMLITLTSILGFGCKAISGGEKSSPKNILYLYVDGLNTSNFAQVTKLISDSLIVMEGNQVLSNNRKEYRTQFQWDSVFHPHYEILELDSLDVNMMELIVSKTCRRIEFLHDSLRSPNFLKGNRALQGTLI